MTESPRSEASTAVFGQGYFRDERLPTAKGAAFDFCGTARGCLPGTRVTLLDQVSKWAIADDDDDAGEKKSIFWLNGMAGTGKSTIARTVAAHLLQDQGAHLMTATFFFSKSETDRRKAERFFGTIAAQLADGSPAFGDALLSALDSDPEISRRALREQWETLIMKPLIAAKETRTVVLVIDALDECENDDHVSTIIRLLSETKGSETCPLRFKALFTSRPEYPAQIGFEQIQGQYENIILHAISNDIIKRDISAFLIHELERIKEDHDDLAESEEKKLPEAWPGEDKVKTLVSMASPLFIYADTIVRFIEDRDAGQPNEQLSKLLGEGGQVTHQPLKSQLNGVYLPVLNQLLVGINKDEIEPAMQEFREVIGSLVLLSEPLTSKSLAALLGKDKSKINETLSHLHSVLSTRGPFEPTRILHLSFRDFLVDPASKDENPFWIDEAACQRELATQCFQLLIIKLRKDICDQSNPAIKRTTILTGTINASIPNHIRYACLYWVYHLEQGNAPGAHLTHDQIGWVKKFLEIHFLHWVEVLCVLGLGYESISMIDALCRLMPNDEPFMEFLHDVRRFLLKFVPITNQYPLQLYSSALFFSPRNSAVRKSFYHKSSGWLPPIFAREEWGACTQTLEGHTDAVSSVAVCRANDLIATASYDGTVKLWDRIGFCKQTLKGHNGKVYSVCFSHDDSRIASASADGTARLWDRDGVCVQTLSGHDDEVRAVSFSDDDKYLATASSDKTVRVWHREGGCQTILAGHSEEVVSVSFAHREFCVVSADSEGGIRVWDQILDPDGPRAQVFQGHSDWATSVVFSHDDRFIASASLDGTIKIWIRTGACFRTIAARPGTSISFSPDDTTIACGSSYDESVNLWEVQSGHCEISFRGHMGLVTDVAISSDNKWLVSGSRDNSLKVWDLASTRSSGRKTPAIDGGLDSVHLSIFSHDKKWLATTFQKDKTLKLWNRITGECVQNFQQTTDDNWLSSTKIKVIGTVKRKTRRGRESSSPGPPLAVRSMVFSHDDKFIATGLDDGFVRIWDLAKGKCTRTLKAGDGYITSLDFSHDGQKLVASSLSGGMTVWGLTTGDVLSSFEEHSDPFCYIAFSPDDQYIASASYDNWRTVKVWKRSDKSCTFKRHSENAEIVAFSADGSYLASASREGAVQFWDLKTSKCVQAFQAKGEVFGISNVGSGFSIDTSAGTIMIGASQEISSKDLEIPGPIGYGLSAEGDWITWCEDNVLWLPPEHRSQVFRAAGPTVAIGCPSGQFLILNFRRNSRSRGFDSKSVDTTRRSLSAGRLSISTTRRSSSHRRDKSQSSNHRDRFW